MPTTEQLSNALKVLVNLVRSIGVKRAITAVEQEPHLNFWRVIQGDLLDMAVIEWCKLFGSDDAEHQQLHWKNVFPDRENFRAGLLGYLGVDQAGFDAYWNHLKDSRDHQAAHLDLDKVLDFYPQMDLAIQSGAFYYRQLIAELRARGETRYPDDLMAYYQDFLEQAHPIATTAVASTRGFPEKVR